MSVVKFNRDNKFDVQLDAALIRERALGDIFANAKIELNRRGVARPGWSAWGNEASSEAA